MFSSLWQQIFVEIVTAFVEYIKYTIHRVKDLNFTKSDNVKKFGFEKIFARQLLGLRQFCQITTVFAQIIL